MLLLQKMVFYWDYDDRIKPNMVFYWDYDDRIKHAGSQYSLLLHGLFSRSLFRLTPDLIV